MIQLIGWFGAALLAIAWLSATIKTAKKKKKLIDPHFTIIYLLASLLLTIYSVFIKDVMFTFLNALATIIAMYNFFYSRKYK